MQEILKPREIAEYLRISYPKCQKLLREGVIPAAKIGKSYRTSRTLLQEWLKQVAWGGGRDDVNGRPG